MELKNKLRPLIKYSKDNWIEGVVYFILLGGFLALMVTKGIFEEKLLLTSNIEEILRLEWHIKWMNTTIYVFTGLNLLFTPHKLYGTVKKPIKEKINNMIKQRRERKGTDAITER